MREYDRHVLKRWEWVVGEFTKENKTNQIKTATMMENYYWRMKRIIKYPEDEQEKLALINDEIYGISVSISRSINWYRHFNDYAEIYDKPFYEKYKILFEVKNGKRI